MTGLLQDEVAVVYGAGGQVGGAVARAFAADGAHVHAAGRTRATLEATVEAIRAAGGRAEAAVVDALDADAVGAHLRSVVDVDGRLDVSMNATGFPDHQGVPIRQMALADGLETVTIALASHVTTAVAAARQMETHGSGVILTLSTSAAGLSGRDRVHHRTGLFGVACAAIEELTLSLAGELGPLGIRVVCLRPDALPDSWSGTDDPAVQETIEYLRASTMLDRMPTLRQVAETAAFLASDRADAITGTTVDVTCGSTAR